MTTTNHTLRMARKIKQSPCPECPPECIIGALSTPLLEIELPVSPCTSAMYFPDDFEPIVITLGGCVLDTSLLVITSSSAQFTAVQAAQTLTLAPAIANPVAETITISATYPDETIADLEIDIVSGAVVPLGLVAPVIDSATNVQMWKNPTTNNRFFPDNFNRMYHAPVANATGVVWHWQLEGFAVDAPGFGMSMLISETEPALNVSVDNTQFLIHPLSTNFSTPKYFNVWYEQCGETSPITTIYFDETGTYPYAVSACGSVDDSSGDIGFTTRTYQWKLDSTSGLYVSLDFIGELFVSDSYPVGRECTWRFTYTGYPPDTLPAGLVFKKYEFPKLMTGPALALFLDPTPPCATPGIPALGTLTVWLEISGVTGASCELIFTLATPGVTC